MEPLTNSSNTDSDSNKLFLRTIQYGSIILLIFGSVGNLTVFAIFFQKKMRQTKIIPYLHCLAFVDVIDIWLNYLRIIWQTSTWHTDTSLTSIFTSNLYGAISFSTNIYSSWITVIISLERLLAIFFPFSSFRSSVRYKPYVVLFLLLVCVTAMYTMLTVFLKNEDYTMCAALLIYSFLPAVILIMSSVLLVYKIFHRPDLGQHFQRNSLEQAKSTIYIVIAINSLFLVTTFPASIYFLVLTLRNQSNMVMYLLLDSIACINNVSNFILYVGFSKSFRQNLKHICAKTPCASRSTVYSVQFTTN